MKEESYDICVVGSGAGAGPIIFELANAGYKVIVLEKGPWIKTQQFTKDEIVASRKTVYQSNQTAEPHIIEVKNSNGIFVKESNKNGGTSFWNGNCVGGSSNFMSGFFHRAKPQDFQLATLYSSIEGANIVDWPIKYEDLEPYYTKVENLIGVSGEVKNHKYQEPRSQADYPFKPLNTNIVSNMIDKAAESLGFESIPIPRAILSSNFGTRRACYYSNYCGSYGCSSDAKGSSRAALIDLAVETGNCIVQTHSKVFRLETNGEGKIEKAHYHQLNHFDGYVKAKIFVVAAQAIETSRLLLLSKNPEFPNGLANNNGQVGKNLLFSAGGSGSGVFYEEDFSAEDFKELLKPGLFVNRAIQSFYEIEDEQFNGKVKGGTIDFLWEHANPIRRATLQKRNIDGSILYGSELKNRLFTYFTRRRKITFEVFNDWLPTNDNYIELDDTATDIYGDKVAKIRINSHPHDLLIGKYLAEKAILVLRKMRAREVKFTVDGSPTPNLQAGGCRFGENPKNSVLDPNCKAHDVDNLYITDGSFMPTGGSVTFTWSIYANSFRVADIIINRLNEQKL